MTKLEEMIQRAGTIAVLGHVNPDGDCIGSCLAVYNYIKDQYPQKQTAVYLEAADQKFSYLRGFEEIRGQWEGEAADLCVCVDCSDRERLGPFVSCLDQAAESVCVDHHVTNEGYAGENIIEPAASSTCEVLFYQFEEERISKAAAECLYTGIIHDTVCSSTAIPRPGPWKRPAASWQRGFPSATSSTTAFTGRRICRARFWAEPCWRASRFWTNGAFFPWSAERYGFLRRG